MNKNNFHLCAVSCLQCDALYNGNYKQDTKIQASQENNNGCI